MLNAILIDDEKNSRESLRKKISIHCPQVQVVAECSNGKEGIEAIQLHHPDIVFLDIEMPHMNGFTMLQHISQRSFGLIFTTAFNQYAIDAIRYSALDYLVKPVDVHDLVAAVNRLMEQKKQPFSIQQVEILQEYLSRQKQDPRKIAVSVASGLEIIDISSIIYLEATGNYTNIYCTEGKPLLSSKNLKEFEELLPASDFCRIHNASLVNIAFIRKYNKGEGGQVVLSNGVVLDVARRRKEDLIALIQSFAKRI